ncbi:MFS general substrate transporter [Violaceomyces palustris]|uniref:MFS general substrate transporter n=1 Tax=Violaceomyces palustris TaxID=1673888 RepID=A0ACD0NM99_9BASI|nr:MFS general substrate transporter [Violaceomyces palustris]
MASERDFHGLTPSHTPPNLPLEASVEEGLLTGGSDPKLAEQRKASVAETMSTVVNNDSSFEERGGAEGNPTRWAARRPRSKGSTGQAGVEDLEKRGDGGGADEEDLISTCPSGRNSEKDGSKEDGPGALPATDSSKDDSALTFPEGGTKAWLCVFGGFWSTFITFGYLNAFGIYQDYYQSLLPEKTSSQISWIGGFQYFLIFSVGIFAGKMFDLGYFRPLFTFGCFLLVFSQMMLSLCTEYYQFFLTQGVGLGLSFGLIFNLSINCPAHHFNRRRGLAMGVMAAGSSTGGTIFPIMIRRLIPSLGFGWTMRAVGFMALGVVIMAWLCLSTRLEPSIDVKDKSKGGWSQVRWIDPEAFKNLAYTFFVAGASLVMFGLYTPFTYMDVFTGYYQIPANGYYLSILNAASIFGRVLPGIVADRVGRINTVLPHLMVSGLLGIIFPACTKLGGLLAFSILYGFTSGCYVSLIPACVAQLGPSSTVGTRNGMMFAIGSFGGLFGTPISGALLGDPPNYRWWAASSFSGVCVLAGSACILASRWFALDKKAFGTI